MIRTAPLVPLASSLLCAVLGIAACGDSDNSVDVVVAEIDFGQTDCGTAAIPRVVTITNNTASSFSFNTGLGLGADSPYTVVPPNGVVLPRSQVNVTVYSKPIPQTSEITDNLYGDTLTVTTDKDGDSPHTVAIKQTARGAIFHASVDSLNFATPIQFGMSSSQPITITNAGNGTANLAATSTFPGISVDANGKTIAAGDSVSAMVTYSPGANVAETFTLSLAAEGPVCGVPEGVRVSGVGTAKGLAAQAVPAGTTNRPNNSGGPSTLCVRLTTGAVACGGGNFMGMRGASDDYILNLGLASGKGGGSGGGGGLGALDVLNAVQTKDGVLKDVVDLVSGLAFYCARTSAGDVWCWGDYNGYGNASTNNAIVPLTERASPQATKVLSGIAAIGAGYWDLCVVKQGTGFLSCRTKRVTNSNHVDPTGWTTTNVSQVSISGGHALARLNDGNVMSWGLNSTGERGFATSNGAGATIPDFSGVSQVAAGGRMNARRSTRFSCAVKADNSVWCWGRNRHGQLGNNTTSQSTTPVQVIDTTDTPIVATKITAGFQHACALSSGSVLCWGRGQEGEVGSGNTAQNVVRAETVTSLTGTTSIEAAGTRATCATLANGSVRCWGQFAGNSYVGPEPVFSFEP